MDRTTALLGERSNGFQWRDLGLKIDIRLGLVVVGMDHPDVDCELLYPFHARLQRFQGSHELCARTLDVLVMHSGSCHSIAFTRPCCSQMSTLVGAFTTDKTRPSHTLASPRECLSLHSWPHNDCVLIVSYSRHSVLSSSRAAMFVKKSLGIGCAAQSMATAVLSTAGFNVFATARVQLTVSAVSNGRQSHAVAHGNPPIASESPFSFSESSPKNKADYL
ncbi:hypothetical protein Ae201684P_003349 [Aphanomyces euteiches]|uniref:Uncharacterized protein n=1 Tax=Aphanomyces euteiches TaxID=100861 RepID=A0A6G0X2Q3_9STRA|nr:hypothetical protein Ae201684_009015 [Aphanomyces euteiches]KAH9073850.1 hypothetical protein Ae201684P_003349 [Aphanomyces euteiches]